jgi:flagellar hook-associated protein 1 FlgK
LSIFDTLGIGRSGLLAHQRAIQVTSNNIANVNTPGYTRQRPVFHALNPSYLPDGFPISGGVQIAEVERVFDAAIDEQLQQERSAHGFDTGREEALARIEGIFSELDGTGINAALSDFFNAFSDLSTAPDESAARQRVVESARSLVSLIRDADRRLSDMQTEANEEIRQTTREITDIASRIAELNRSIFAKEGQGDGPAASGLRDQRSLLLHELGERIDFTSFERDGQLSIFVGGGFMLVDGESAGGLSAQPSATDPTKLDVFQQLLGQANGPITSRISSGSLAAAIDSRDSTVPGYRADLDAFAFSLAQRVNALHYPDPAPALPAGAFGLVDDQLRRFFVDSTQPVVAEGADFAQVSGAASAIAIQADILSDARHVAAGTESLGAGLGAAPGDGRNAAAIAELATSSASVYRLGDAVGAPTGPSATLGGYYDGVAGRLGAELQSTRLALQQEDLIISELEDRRGAISGVSIDEEVANLVRFERAYQASARVISTADELLARLLEI